MKRLKSILTVLAAVVMIFGTMIQAKAGYEYKVTILAGLHGTLNGQEKVEIPMKPGERWNPNTYADMINITDPRFYFKGFHESGKEDLTTGGAQDINKDMVFVASYGMKGKTVDYTVRFLDAAGNTLIPARTFYGNVGDKPVIACDYIEGYTPQAPNLTKTLSADPTQNIFTFIYVPGEAVNGGGGGVTGNTGYTYTDDGTEVVYLPGGNAGGGNQNANAAGNQNANANANQQNAANPAGADQNTVAPADNGNDSQVEVIDLDDTDVPLANVTSPGPEETTGTNNHKPGLNFFWIAAMILSGFGIIALIAILIFLAKKRKEQYQE